MGPLYKPLIQFKTLNDMFVMTDKVKYNLTWDYKAI